MWQGRLNLRNKKCNKIVLDKQEGRIYTLNIKVFEIQKSVERENIHGIMIKCEDKERLWLEEYAGRERMLPLFL